MYNVLLLIFILLIPLENKTSSWLNFGNGINLTTIFIVLFSIKCFLNISKNRGVFIKTPLNKIIFLFSLSLLLSFVTGYLKLGIAFLGPQFRVFKSVIFIFVLFFIIVILVKKDTLIAKLLFLMSLMVTISALLSIKEYKESHVWHFNSDTRSEIFGLQPNMLGAFLAQYIPLFISLSHFSKKAIIRIICFTLSGISLGGLMFTYSRGAYLAIGISLFVIGMLIGKRFLIRLVLLLTILLSFNYLISGHARLIPVSVTERFDSIKTADEDRSVQYRKEAWAIAKDYIEQAPIVGYGYGSSDYLLPRDTHNMYLDNALEAGIPSMILFVLFLIVALKMSIRAYKKTVNRFYKSITLGTVGSIISLSIGNYFGTRLQQFSTNGYFAILLGLTAIIYYKEFVKND